MANQFNCTSVSHYDNVYLTEVHIPYLLTSLPFLTYHII